MALLTIIQARTGSTRLPSKVLLKLGSKTVLEHVLHRLSLCEADLGTVVVATGPRGRDNPIQDIALASGAECFRGSETDVLHRFHSCAHQYGATNILRVTADCPLLDPQLVDTLVRGGAGDISRIAGAPKGLGEEELITADALRRLWRDATDPYDREHVSTFADGNPDYRLHFIDAPDWLFDHQRLRLVLDTPEDWERLSTLYHFTKGALFDLSSEKIVAMHAVIDDPPHGLPEFWRNHTETL